MEMCSGQSGCCINEEDRRQMSWADQVDLVYPLEECWSESCLTDPHFCMEDHHMPELRSEEEKVEEVVSHGQAKDHGDTCDLREVDTAALGCCSHGDSGVSLDQTPVYKDPSALREVKSVTPWWLRDAEGVVSLDQTEFCDDPFALREKSITPWWLRDAEGVVNLYQTEVYDDPYALREVETDCGDPFALREVKAWVVQEGRERGQPGPGLQGSLCHERGELEGLSEGMTTSCPPHTTLAFPHATFLDLRPPGQDYCYIHAAEISWPLRLEA